MICSTTSLKDLCIFLLGLNLLLLENGCPNVFDHSSHEKCQAEPDNQELFTPRQPKHPMNICHRTALSSHKPKPVPRSVPCPRSSIDFLRSSSLYLRRYTSCRLMVPRPRTLLRGPGRKIPLTFQNLPLLRHSLAVRPPSVHPPSVHPLSFHPLWFRSLSWHSPCNWDFGNQ